MEFKFDTYTLREKNCQKTQIKEGWRGKDFFCIYGEKVNRGSWMFLRFYRNIPIIGNDNFFLNKMKVPTKLG